MSSMKEVFSIVSTCAMFIIACSSLSSCNNDDFVNPTKTNGLPSAFFSTKEDVVSLSYQNNQLIQSKKKDGSSKEISYEKGKMKISYNPPSDVADGHGCRTFEQKDANTIQISSNFEPSPETQIEEITLNEWQRPLKITVLGWFQQTDKGLVKLREINNYALFTYDATGKHLTKIEQFDSKNNLIKKTTLEYDNANGTTSGIKFPTWFPDYWCYINASGIDNVSIQFLNHYNNVTAIAVNNIQEGSSQTFQYQYTYNKDNYPTEITSNIGNPQIIKIQY